MIVWSSVVWAVTPLTSSVDGDAFVVRFAAGSDPDLALERAAGMAPPEASEVRVEIEGPDGSTVTPQSLRPVGRVGPDKDEGPFRARFDHPGAAPGFLTNRAVYMSQCHGWIWSDALGRFATQRGEVHDTVEDFHNPEGADQFLLAYLENAGASVFTARERDRNPVMAISDDDGAGYTEVGAGFADGASGFGEGADWAYGENPFTAGSTRTFPAQGGGVARFEPTVPYDGTFAVYVAWDSNALHATDAHYRITHPGGVIDRWFDQTVHGSTWQYVETLWLTAGSSLVVELVGDSADADALLSADAVRIGGGMDDVSRHGVTVGRPRWETGAIQYTQFNGAPASVYDPYGDGASSDGGSDPSSRSNWADWEHPSGEDAVFLSWHSNAFDGTARGTTTYWGGSCAAAGSDALADTVQDELIDMIYSSWDPSWYDRGVNSSCFSELDGSFNDEMPAVLVELAFHDNADDASYLKNPRFRDDASRAMYRGIVRYFAERDGIAPAYLPEPPVEVSLLHDADGALVASWTPGDSGAPFGDPAASWLLYRSADGRAWDGGTPVSGTSAVVDAATGERVYVRVAGVNAGGVSFPSEVVGAVRSPGARPPVLVVAGFERLDTGLLDFEDVPDLGGVVRMDVRHMNARDIAVAHGEAIGNAGVPFETVSLAALPAVDLGEYLVVVWASGEQSTVDETFDAAAQSEVRAFVESGGGLVASGAEILWDLDASGSSSDRAFADEVLGALLDDDISGSTVADGAGLLAALGPLDFGVADGAPYPVEYADVLASDREVVATYGDGRTAGVFGSGVALFGFPLDCIGDPATRDAVFEVLLDELLAGWVPTDPGTTPTDTGTVAGPVTEPGVAGSPSGRQPLEPRGCGCSSTGRAGPGLALLLVGLARRRVRTTGAR